MAVLALEKALLGAIWPVLLWDISYGPDYDLRQLRAQHKIVGWMRAGKIRGGHLGPCHSFTRARDHPPGPPPLRSNNQPLGLRNLSLKDSVKVRTGNSLMRFSVRAMTLAIGLRVPFTMENPRTSRIWLCPSVLHLLRRPQCRIAFTEFCQFGTPWRKSTQFAGANICLDSIASYRCLGVKKGFCSFTGCRHVVLSGQTAHGQRRTKIAEPYPAKLCNVLAQCFRNCEIASLAEIFGNGYTSELAGLGS